MKKMNFDARMFNNSEQYSVVNKIKIYNKWIDAEEYIKRLEIGEKL